MPVTTTCNKPDGGPPDIELIPTFADAYCVQASPFTTHIFVGRHISGERVMWYGAITLNTFDAANLADLLKGTIQKQQQSFQAVPKN
jgi:hypothetical protein